jgi:hypothetical protein
MHHFVVGLGGIGRLRGFEETGEKKREEKEEKGSG